MNEENSITINGNFIQFLINIFKYDVSIKILYSEIMVNRNEIRVKIDDHIESEQSKIERMFNSYPFRYVKSIQSIDSRQFKIIFHNEECMNKAVMNYKLKK